jgi:hypothetical protein
MRVSCSRLNNPTLCATILGQGIILKSPKGGTCLRLTTTDAGTLEQTIMACPM